MVITRQKNATAEANPSVTKFTKEQNDLKMKELQEYSANKSLDQYHLKSICSLVNFFTLVFASAIAYCCLVITIFYAFGVTSVSSH